MKFQFTHPVRGATQPNTMQESLFKVSIHAPRAGCDLHGITPVYDLLVSIHAPRAGCDVEIFSDPVLLAVSIHAPRAGCDLQTG